jgi:putative ABC transport system permease protein
MTTLRRLLLRVTTFFRPGHADAELDRELGAHLALIEDELRRRGMSPEQARLAARRSFHGVEQTKERHRDARSVAWLEDLRRDVAYALRTLRRTPGFTIAAILTLAVGIGGTTAVFSVFNAVLLRPLPFPAADRLVLVFEENARSGFPTDAVRPRSYAAWLADNQVFDSIAAVAGHGMVLGGGTEPERITGQRVTRSFFAVVGTSPLHGRTFAANEDRPGGPRVALLSYRLWQRRFGGDPAVVGRDILLSGEPYTVIGVMPRGFQFLESYVSVWVPAAFSSQELAQGGRYLTVVGRLKAPVTAAGAAANLDTIAGRMSRLYPDDERWKTLRAVTVPFDQHISGAARRPLMVLLVAVGVVLVVACANLASLLLARTAARRQELVLRGALGASRGRVVRQLLTESALLAASGLALGVVLAWWAFAFLARLVPPEMTLFAHPTLDGRTLAAAAVSALITTLAFGLAPALHTTAAGGSDALRAGGRSTSSGQRARSGLVVAEVALTLVLLVAAGLLLHTLYRLRYADLGLRPERVLTLRTVLPQERYADAARRARFYDAVLERVERLPGVAAAGYTTSVPLEWKGATSEFAIDGQPPDPAMTYDANHRQVSAGYLQTMGVTLREGRYFGAADDERGSPVVIVNQAMARRYWRGETVVGQRIAIDPGAGGIVWRTIVGVVGDVRQMGLDVPARPEIYIPYRQFDTQPWFAPRDLAVRTIGNPLDSVNPIKHEIHAVDPALPVSNIRTFDEVLDEEVAGRRVGTTTLAAFAAFALVLAILGIYGVIAYFVVQHVPEIGVRLALGAQPRDIIRLIVGKGMTMAAIGVAVGALAAPATARLMSSLLHGVPGTSAVMCLSAAALLLVLAFVASYLPARRALRHDPIAALRVL